MFDKFDFAQGSLPPWLAPFVELTRPMATTMTALILPAGAFTVAVVAAFDEARAMAMVNASTAFMKGIPIEVVMLIGTILTAAFATSSYEFGKSSVQPKNEEPDPVIPDGPPPEARRDAPPPRPSPSDIPLE